MTGWLEDVESESQEIGIDLDLTYRSYYIRHFDPGHELTHAGHQL